MIAITIENHNEREKALIEFKANNLQFDELSTRISLRLNWDEHKDLINTLDELKQCRLNTRMKDQDFTQLHFLLTELKGLAKDILSTEWKVVKDGEKLFLKFKYISRFLASTFVVAAYVLFTIAILNSSIFQW